MGPRKRGDSRVRGESPVRRRGEGSGRFASAPGDQPGYVEGVQTLDGRVGPALVVTLDDQEHAVARASGNVATCSIFPVASDFNMKFKLLMGRAASPIVPLPSDASQNPPSLATAMPSGSMLTVSLSLMRAWGHERDPKRSHFDRMHSARSLRAGFSDPTWSRCAPSGREPPIPRGFGRAGTRCAPPGTGRA